MKTKIGFVTPAMTDAGVEIMNDCLVASAARALNGLGGGPTWKKWLRTYSGQNKDLVKLYVSHKIRSVDACYIAMQRVAISQLIERSKT
jgi:hypothetical protein